LTRNRYAAKTNGICEALGVTFNVYRSSDKTLVYSVDAPGSPKSTILASALTLAPGEQYYVQATSRSVFCTDTAYPYSPSKSTSSGFIYQNSASPIPVPPGCVGIVGQAYCPIPPAGLPAGNYYFLFADSNNNFFLSPNSNGLGWNWNSFQALEGIWTYGLKGVIKGTINCISGEAGVYGTSCSTAAGTSPKALGWTGYDPASSTGNVCQVPIVFSAICQTVGLYYRAG